MIYFRDAQKAFADAIASKAMRRPADFMYMGTERTTTGWSDTFKQRDTRAYRRFPAPAPTAADVIYRRPGELVTLAEALA